MFRSGCFSVASSVQASPSPGGWKPYFRRARNAINAPAIAATIAPTAMIKAALARVFALIASPTASRIAFSISVSRSAAASTRLSLRS
jgi:hypothetical protein